jgi:hypothetical protein
LSTASEALEKKNRTQKNVFSASHLLSLHSLLAVLAPCLKISIRKYRIVVILLLSLMSY